MDPIETYLLRKQAVAPTVVEDIAVRRSDEVTALFRDWMAKQAAFGITQAQMARSLGVADGVLSNIKHMRGGVGIDMEKAFARIFSGGSVDKLRRVAHEKFEGAARTV